MLYEGAVSNLHGKGRPKNRAPELFGKGLDARVLMKSQHLVPCGGVEMFNPFKKRRVIKFKHKVAVNLDGHKWASKMETHRLVSSKPPVKLIQRPITGTVR